MKIDSKRFPADTAMNTVTFLNDKKINGELYAYLQYISTYKMLDDSPRHSLTYVEKKSMPKQTQICETLGIKSTKTLRAHLNYLIERGYVIDIDNKYVLPQMEDIYFLIPLPTLQYLNDNCKDHIIKIYVYLGQRYKYAMERGSVYHFTLEEIGEHIGLKIKNNSRGYEMINNALDLLVNSGLIDYVTYFDGQMQRKKLTKFSYEFKSKKLDG